MTQKEIKQRYISIICDEVWPKSQKMQQYAEKEFCFGVELANDDIFIINKPRIRKDFCFGYGYCGRSDEEDYRGAMDMADHAATNTDYFFEENLKDLNRTINCLMDPRYEVYKYCAYCGQQKGSKLKTYRLCDSWENPDNDPGGWSHLVDVEKMSQAERKALIAGYDVVKKLFIKRLNTYLKRYGLSKINTWTYLRD